MSGYTAGHGFIYVCCSLLSFVPSCNALNDGISKKQERSDPQMFDQFTEVRDVVFVIQSQKNSYHTHRAEQRRTELLYQAQTLNQSSPDVVLLHKLSDYDGNWSILPALPRLASQYCLTSLWIVFLEEETNVNLHNLLQVLSKFNTRKEWFLGRPLHDDEPTIIHHYAFSEDPYSFSYPDFMAGWALSCPLAKRTAERVNYEPPKSDFTIDLQHEIALYIWEEGRGPALTVVNEFCSELQSLSSTGNCATTINTYLSACGNPVQKEDVFVAVKTCQRFHGDRVPLVKQTWEKDAASLEYYSDITDPYIPTIHLGVPNTERGHCAKTFAILKRFASGAVTQAPWLLIVDDDTLISLPRLRRLLGCYDPNEAVSVGERYGYGLSRDGYSYITGGGGMVFSRVAVQNILAGGCGCRSSDAPDDMVLGMCLTALGLLVTHSPLFHQARPQDYVKELLARQSPISFHKHWNINPVAVYQHWLAEPNQRRAHSLTKTREEL
ncbi:beta-1,3-glucosyltransferase [Sinocyclocheilus grahami]|uniref:beta-1,3-glucosyltransferase n=1 Tax=Sinocyclocheilus grahami TaxID=75366 RepID=UPI0007AC8CD4|nr:PREDICTED: beta-1,3-glucosyltransferase-like [Sinocyclocheilus grahami]